MAPHILNTSLAFIGMPGHWELLVILAIGLLLFGRRLPEVGRNIGKTVVEFRKGIKDIENEVEDETRRERAALPKDESASVQADDRAVAQQPAPKTSEA